MTTRRQKRETADPASSVLLDGFGQREEDRWWKRVLPIAPCACAAPGGSGADELVNYLRARDGGQFLAFARYADRLGHRGPLTARWRCVRDALGD